MLNRPEKVRGSQPNGTRSLLAFRLDVLEIWKDEQERGTR